MDTTHLSFHILPLEMAKQRGPFLRLSNASSQILFHALVQLAFQTCFVKKLLQSAEKFLFVVYQYEVLLGSVLLQLDGSFKVCVL